MKYKALRQATDESLAAASINPKKLAAIHAGVTVLVMLLLTVGDYLLGNAVEGTGGIANLGNRAILRTLQTVLGIGSLIALPLWDLGFTAAALGLSRRETVSPLTLTEGFRRFFPIVRMYILQLIILTLVGIACWQVGSTIFALTPLSDRFVAVTLEVLGVTDPMQMMALSEEALLTAMEAITDAQMTALIKSMIPMYIILGILLLVVGFPLYLRFRMVPYAVMGDIPRARKSLLHVTRILRGRKRWLILLDLHFWWYYAGQLVIMLIPFAGEFLAMAGVTLPLPDAAQGFLFYGIYLALQFLMTWRFGARVHTTYAHFYRSLEENPPKPRFLFTPVVPMPPQQEETGDQ